jgi:exonuclease SbcD
MPRLLHLADVHLGARHHDLGDAAATQRERQFDAFRRAVDLALAEKVDVVLVAGDLFDSNQQPRRSVERAAAEFGRLAAAGVRTVVIPGTHDVYDPSSIYRINDLAAMAGLKAGSELIVVLTPEPHPWLAPRGRRRRGRRRALHGC